MIWPEKYVLIYAITWMNLDQNYAQWKNTQTKKTTSFMIHSYEMSRIKKSLVIGSREGIAEG